MSTRAKATIKARLVLEDRTVIVKERDVLTGVHYQSGDQELVVDGRIRVICANTRANNQIPTNCPPEPFVQNYITPTMLILDSSAEHDAEIIRIAISDIRTIDHISSDDTREKAIDEAIMAIPDATVTEISDNNYEIKTSTGSITTGELFQVITELGGYDSVEVTCADQAIRHQAGEDLETFKQEVDALLPKSYKDEPVTLTMLINFI